MSRVGSLPIQIPNGVTVEVADNTVNVNGPKGHLEINIEPGIKVELADNTLLVTRKNDEKKNKSLHGLYRTLISNMVNGVNEGWSKRLELVGVGYRAQGGGDKITLAIGFSHPVEFMAPEGISFEVKDNTKISVSGIDKQLVGEVAAKIRKIRKPEPYKGKGIRYEGEYIRRKAGKAGKTGAK